MTENIDNFGSQPSESPENTNNPWLQMAAEVAAENAIEDSTQPAETAPDHEQLPRIEIKNLSPEDNLAQAAEAIYLTDQYICPDLFGDEERAKVFGPALFSDDPDALFSYNKTLVAKDEEGNIAGILVYRDANCSKWDKEALRQRFLATGAELSDGFERVNDVYMEKVTGAELPADAAEIEFIGVRDDYRSQGIGKQMMAELISKPEYGEIHLDVLDSHPWASKSYTEVGFRPNGAKFGNYPDGSEGVQHMILRKTIPETPETSEAQTL